MLARALWHRLETINAVTYFSPECRAAPVELGLEGFWNGYVACRAAPLGAVGPGPVEAMFCNFPPKRTTRALPAAWSVAPPEAFLTARASSASVALRRLLTDGEAEALAADCVGMLHTVVDGAVAAGRPLFAANAEVATPDDPVAELWQLATTLREHRGDGHVALLASAGLDGCEVLVLFAAGGGAPADLLQRSRGWSDDEWEAASDRLSERGLVRGDSVTPSGAALRTEIEARTDELAAVPYGALGEDRTTDLLDRTVGAARTIAGAGEIAYPNPMGLPAPG
jgi:hypothetical protein